MSTLEGEAAEGEEEGDSAATDEKCVTEEEREEEEEKPQGGNVCVWDAANMARPHIDLRSMPVAARRILEDHMCAVVSRDASENLGSIDCRVASQERMMKKVEDLSPSSYPSGGSCRHNS
jgi:hypothetical protein